MEISAEKTKTNSIKRIEKIKITVSGQELESVHQFKYLGAILSEGGLKTADLARAAQTAAALAKLKPMWKHKNISLSTKLKLLHAFILSIFLNARQTRTLTSELQRKIQTIEMRCPRRVFGISYTEHTTNEAALATISKHLKHYEDRDAYNRQETKTAMVWSCDKSQWPIEDRPPRYSSRWKKKGQAEKEMDGQHCRVDMIDRKELCHDPSPCPGPSEVETACRAFNSAVPPRPREGLNDS